MVRTGEDLAAFSRWVQRVLETLKQRKGWGIVKVSQEADVPRSTITRWRDGQWELGIPTRAVVERFCENLKLKKTDPFAYMGWILDEESEVDDSGELFEIPPETALDRQIRLINARLGQKPPTEERRRLERLLVRAKRQREEQREMDEEIAELLGGEPDPSHPSE